MKNKTSLYLILLILGVLLASTGYAFGKYSNQKDATDYEHEIVTLPQVIQNEMQIGNEETKMFPKPAVGMKRFIFKVSPLPTSKHESESQIQIIVGKNMLVDCNSHTIMASLEKKELKEWGYTYYELSESQGELSTLIGCMNTPKREEFITTNSEPFLVPYNSKMPIVVYVPANLQVRYKILKSGAEIFAAKEQ